MRRKARRDGNHHAIKGALLGIPGVAVFDTSHLGDGIGDLLVAYRTRLVMMEIKDPSKPPCERRLTEAETKMAALFPRHYVVVHTLDDALDALGIGARPRVEVTARELVE